MKAHALTLRIGDTHFEVSRVINTSDPQQNTSSWVAYSSFSALHAMPSVQKHYEFEFATPTAFSQGQKPWGKQLLLFPTPSLVFENLARQWEIFAPAHLRLENLTPQAIGAWCDEHIIVSQYALSTRYLSSSKFGHVGFQGHVTYEVKGNPTAPTAHWLSPLARLALFAGIGYKTAMGMGQARCTNLSVVSPSETVSPVVRVDINSFVEVPY
jgi:CRISPR-associated endoribonuclease Cas6